MGNNGKKQGLIEFVHYSEVLTWIHPEDLQMVRATGVFLNRRHYICKVPVKGLFRTPESRAEDYYDGTFWDIGNTTMIPVEAFLYCMCIKELGVEGFWVYSFIKFKSGYYGGYWDEPLEEMSIATGIGTTKLGEVLRCLEAHGMISNDHKPYVMGKPGDVHVKACSYAAYDGMFSMVPNQVEKRRVVSFKQYALENGIEHDSLKDESGQN